MQELSDIPAVRTAKRHLEQARERLSQLEDGFVRRRLVGNMGQLEMELDERERRLSAPSPTLLLKLKLPDGSSVVLSGVSTFCTVAELRGLVQEASDIPAALLRIVSVSSGTILTECPEDTRVSTCGVQNKDLLRVERVQQASGHSSTAQSSSDTEEVLSRNSQEALAMVQRSEVNATSSFEAIALVLHALTLTQGFKCVSADSRSAVPGFAPAVREVPEKKLVPNGWNSDPNAISFSYKHGKANGKTFTINLLLVEDELTISAVQSGDDNVHMFEVQLHAYISEDGSSRLKYRNLEQLRNLFTTCILERLLPALAPAPSSSDREWRHPAEYDPLRLPQRPQTDDHRSGGAFPTQPWGPRVGTGDLFPGAGGIGGEGSLVGPDHPFFGDFPGMQPRGGPFPQGLPQPRFDPYGPVPGLDPMGNFGGRGRGRGRGQGRGEPNPDHLKPPTFNDDGFI